MEGVRSRFREPFRRGRPATKNTRSLLSILTLAALGLLLAGSTSTGIEAGNWAERYPSKMTPGLGDGLADLGEGETFDVYAVMKERVFRDELERVVAELPFGERHPASAWDRSVRWRWRGWGNGEGRPDPEAF